MCGIVGALSFKNSNFQITASYISKMRDTMAHRGPDGLGIWISEDKKIGLGHRRLSIIDLSEQAAQPMCTADGSLWISFNGEIYNHAEIRSELNTLNRYSWKTSHSDTEVILHAFEEWGIQCIDKFRGMFAIALWDNRAKVLWLIRDRIGIKPLYYSIHHNRITFSSEIKALLQDPEQKREVDEEAFYHYLSFLISPAPNTLFKGIHKLQAGRWLKISEDGLCEYKRYWDVLDHTADLKDYNEDQLTEKILDELRTAVKYRKVSDVPVGIFLSGGIDSSTNAALFAEGEEKPIKTFTIGYKGEYPSYQNELKYAKLMADSIGAEYHERLLTIDDLLDFLPQMIRLQDEPLADPVCFPVYYVSQLAKNSGVTVCQVGEGADELFCGYPSWKTALQCQHYNNWPIPGFVRSGVLQSLKILGHEHRQYYQYLNRGIARLPAFWGGAESFTEIQKKSILSETLQKKFKHYSSWEAIQPIYQNFQKHAKEQTPLNWMTYMDLNLRLPELLLMRVDKMSMGVGLEARVPFLDHKFVELIMSIPESIKTKNGELKYILKKSVKGLIPSSLIKRKKQGFGVPVYEWLFDRLGKRVDHTITEFCRESGFLNEDNVNRIVSGKKEEDVWCLFNLALWWKEFIVK